MTCRLCLWCVGFVLRLPLWHRCTGFILGLLLRLWHADCVCGVQAAAVAQVCRLRTGPPALAIACRLLAHVWIAHIYCHPTIQICIHIGTHICRRCSSSWDVPVLKTILNTHTHPHPLSSILPHIPPEGVLKWCGVSLLSCPPSNLFRSVLSGYSENSSELFCHVACGLDGNYKDIFLLLKNNQNKRRNHTYLHIYTSTHKKWINEKGPNVTYGNSISWLDPDLPPVCSSVRCATFILRDLYDGCFIFLFTYIYIYIIKLRALLCYLFYWACILIL